MAFDQSGKARLLICCKRCGKLGLAAAPAREPLLAEQWRLHRMLRGAVDAGESDGGFAFRSDGDALGDIKTGAQ